MTDHRGNWIQTFTGRQFWPLDPRPEEIDIRDIAHALSLLCRFGGHVERFYSVAEHSVHVATSLPEELQLWGLLHDASEAYLVDVPRPIKPYLPAYKQFEAELMSAIARRYQLPGEIPAEVHEADNRILITERNALLVAPPAPWAFEPEPLDVTIHCWEPRMAESIFLDAFHALT
jgi:hypothetical protein